MASPAAVAATEAREESTGRSTDEAPRGPIPIRDMRPYNLLFLQFLPESPDALAPGRSRFRLQLDASNNLLIPSPAEGATVVEDAEVQRLTLFWRRGIGVRSEVALVVPLVWRNGGFMDPVLSWWHRLLGIPANGEDVPGGRDGYAQFRSNLLLKDAQGRTLVDARSALGIGDLSLTWKQSLKDSLSHWNLAFRLGAKLPTGNPGLLLGSGGPDIGASLDARISLSRSFILYGNLGGVLMSKATRVPNAARSMAQYVVALEYRANSRDSYFWQWDGSGLAVRTGNRFADGPQRTATFGYERVLDPRCLLYASFSENGDIHNYSLPWFSGVGPDFTVSVGVEWRR